MLTMSGTFPLSAFYGWLNPELPREEIYRPSRLLSQFAEVDEETYWEFLEMMPPVNFTGASFAICEAATDNIRLAFFRIRGRYFAAYVSDNDPEYSMSAVRSRITAIVS